MSGFTLTMLIGILMFGVKAIRAHSKWMDQIQDVNTAQLKFDTEWKPKIIAHDMALSVVNAKLDIIIRNQEEFIKGLRRRDR